MTSMGIDTIAILVVCISNSIGIGFVAWRLVRLESTVENLRATAMAQFEYVIREIRRVEADEPVPDDGRDEEDLAPEKAPESVRVTPQPVVAD